MLPYHLNRQDAVAVVAYLRSLKPASPVQPAAQKAPAPKPEKK